MSNEIFPSDRVYKFLRVEEYFDRYKEWQKMERVVGHSFNREKKSLGLEFDKGDGSKCLMLVQVPQNDTLRVRFNPTKSTEQEYRGLRAP